MTDPYTPGLGTGGGTSTDRINGVVASLAIKAPVRTAITTPISLYGEQTINGLALVTGDRALVMGQANTVENGVYNVSSTNWNRAADFDGNRDAIHGTMVLVTDADTPAAAPLPPSEPYYAITQAETDAGLIVDIGVMGQVADTSFKPGNIMRYGADPGYSADSAPALQAAINQLSHEESGQEASVFIPRGRYVISDHIYCFYNAVENPGHHTNPKRSRVIIRGEGRGTNNFKTTTHYYGGSYLFFDEDKTFYICDANGLSSFDARSWEIVDFSIVGTATAAPIINLKGARESTFLRLTIHHLGAGTAVEMADLCCNMDIELGIRGSATGTGTGINYATGAGSGDGGIINWKLVLVLLEYPAIFGSAYAAATGNASLWTFERLDIESSTYPVWFRCGIGKMVINAWGESNINGYLKFTDGAGKFTSNTAEEGIKITGRLSMAITSGPRAAAIQLGDDTLGSDAANSHGAVVIEDMQFPWVALDSLGTSATLCIKRFNSPENGTVNIIRPYLQGSGGQFLEIKDEAQIEEIIIHDATGMTPLQNTGWVVDSAGASKIWWVSFTNDDWYPDLVQVAAFDYSAASKMPKNLMTAIRATDVQTITLPVGSNLKAFRATIMSRYAFAYGTPSLELDAGVGKINGTVGLTAFAIPQYGTLVITQLWEGTTTAEYIVQEITP